MGPPIPKCVCVSWACACAYLFGWEKQRKGLNSLVFYFGARAWRRPTAKGINLFGKNTGESCAEPSWAQKSFADRNINEYLT